MTFGELRVGVDFNPSGNTLVDTIKRKAADLIDHINGLETADFNEPGEVARLKALAMTDIKSAAHWAVKASARSGAAQRRLVTTLRQFCDLVGWLRLRRWLQAIERVAEVERAAQATAPAGERRAVDKVAKALIDGGARPQGTARRRNRQPRLWVGRDGGQARGAPMSRRLAAPAPRVEAPHSAPRPLHGAPRRRPPTPSPRHATSVPHPPLRWRPSARPTVLPPHVSPQKATAQPQHPRICVPTPASPCTKRLDGSPRPETARRRRKCPLPGPHRMHRRQRAARSPWPRAERAPQHRCLRLVAPPLHNREIKLSD